MTKQEENKSPREGLETAGFPTVKVVGSNPAGPTIKICVLSKIFAS